MNRAVPSPQHSLHCARCSSNPLLPTLCLLSKPQNTPAFLTQAYLTPKIAFSPFASSKSKHMFLLALHFYFYIRSFTFNAISRFERSDCCMRFSLLVTYMLLILFTTTASSDFMSCTLINSIEQYLTAI